MAEASLADMRARISPGAAMAVMMPMMATTISSSIRVKPPLPLAFMVPLLRRSPGGLGEPAAVD